MLNTMKEFYHYHTLRKPIFKHFTHPNCCLSEPGVIQFEKRGYLVKESVGDAEINVVRQNGADGVITVNYSTKDKTAVDGKDYEGQNGLLTFNHGETHQVTLFSWKTNHALPFLQP